MTPIQHCLFAMSVLPFFHHFDIFRTGVFDCTTVPTGEFLTYYCTHWRILDLAGVPTKW